MLESIASHLDQFAALAPTWGIVLVFIFMAIESSFIPFPSEVVMIPAGFLAARGELGFASGSVALVVAIVAGVVGSLVGAYINYALAFWVGKPFLERYGKWFFLNPKALNRACEIFNRYGAMTTFICRMLPAIRQLVSLPAGLSKMPLSTFTLFTLLGAGIWTTLLAVVGWMLGKSVGDISYLELCQRGKAMVMANLPWVLAGAVVMILLYRGVSRLIMKKELK